MANTSSIFWMYAWSNSAMHHIFFPPRLQLVALEQNPDCLSAHIGYQLAFDRLFGDQADRPTGPAFRRLSKRAEITWSIRPWKNPVIPLAVELRLLHVQPFHNLVWDFYSCWIDLRIKAGLNSQSGFGGGIPNQVHDDLVTF